MTAPDPVRTAREAELRAAIHAWIREDVPLAGKMNLMPKHVAALVGKIASLRAKTAGGAREDQFWLELREPRRVPERKGPWPHRMLAKILREFMEARPTAYISVVTLHHYGPDFQDGPEALMMADGRSTSTGLKHIHRCRAAHGTNALPLDPSPQGEGGGE